MKWAELLEKYVTARFPLKSQNEDLPFDMNDLQLLILSCYDLKDPEGVKVDIIEEEDFTGIVSFPDFKIPPNPK